MGSSTYVRGVAAGLRRAGWANTMSNQCWIEGGALRLYSRRRERSRLHPSCPSLDAGRLPRAGFRLCSGYENCHLHSRRRIPGGRATCGGAQAVTQPALQPSRQGVCRPSLSRSSDRRPVVVVQGDAFNRSRISTVVCVPLTSNLNRADAPGNVLLTAALTGLAKDSVANVSQPFTVDRRVLAEPVGKLPVAKLRLLLSGIDVVLGR
jgi:mRNA interferase MazF